MQKGWQTYSATVSTGEARVLQADGSGVELHIPKGSYGLYLTSVFTNYFRLKTFILGEECLVGPAVHIEHIHLTKKEEPIRHFIQIPHCLQDRTLWRYIKIRRCDLHRDQTPQELQQGGNSVDKQDFFLVDGQYIYIYTTKFSLFTCTSCKNTCQGTAATFVLGHLRYSLEVQKTTVKLKAFLCSDLYRIPDFKSVSVN